MRPTARHLVATLVATGLLAALVAPATAKEFLQARLDAPIAMDTPPGTEILVGVSVDDAANNPVVSSPIHLILTGRYGATTRAGGMADGKPGHYAMRIAIPPGGARRAEVVMHGTSDLPLMLMNDPFTFGPVTARTAQVAPPLAPPPTPFPRASAAPLAPAAQPAPAAGAADPAEVVPQEAAASPVPAGTPPVAVAGLLGLVAASLLAAVAVIRRSRGSRVAPAAGRAPGA